ncbi:MAG: HD domain-containing protein, partial [candidate division KSB1 bacterium]|nr:HD domain-containing protein [candidate division KSB1 bacterium]
MLGLSHDIGKIEGSPHSSLSAEKLKALIPDDVFWKEKILDAVKKHHSRTDDEYSTLLRKADIQARNYEMARFTPGITVSPLERWFDADEFMVKYLEPLVNVTQTNDTIAFTLNGIVYLKTSA